MKKSKLKPAKFYADELIKSGQTTIQDDETYKINVLYEKFKEVQVYILNYENDNACRVFGTVLIRCDSFHSKCKFTTSTIRVNSIGQEKGSKTRLVDEYIQELFNYHQVTIKSTDYSDGVINRIKRRLLNEHLLRESCHYKIESSEDFHIIKFV